MPIISRTRGIRDDALVAPILDCLGELNVFEDSKWCTRSDFCMNVCLIQPLVAICWVFVVVLLSF